MANSIDEWIYGDDTSNSTSVETTATDTPETVANDTKEPEADDKAKETDPEVTSAKGDKVADKLGNDTKDNVGKSTPSDAKSDILAKREHAFSAMRHKFEQRVAKANKERDDLKRELESLRKEMEASNSFVEKAMIGREAKALERKIESVETPSTDWDESNALALEVAEACLPETHLEEYKTRIAPYRASLYEQLDRLAPKLSEYLQESDIAPAVEMALASPHANEILKHLAANSYRECQRRCEDYVNRLFPKKEIETPKEPEPAPKANDAKTRTKVSTPSVNVTNTEPKDNANIPDMATIASWF